MLNIVWGVCAAMQPTSTAQWLNPPAPRPQPAASLWQVWLLETPWYPAAVLALVGLLGFVLLRRLHKPTPAVMVMGSCLGLACAILAAGLTVRTPREMMLDASRALVAAVARADGAAVDTMLDESCQLRGFGPIGTMDKPGIVGAVRNKFAANGAFAVSSCRIDESQAAAIGGGVGTTQLLVSATPKGGLYNAPVRTWWRIDWKLDTATKRVRAVAIAPLWLPE